MAPGRSVAIIGCGKFAYSVLARHLAALEPHFLRGAYDIEGNRALSLCKRYMGAYATISLDEIMRDDSVSSVYIASNHATHAMYAVECIRRGKGVHIEKPHAVSESQLDNLIGAMLESPDVPVVMGYNRPRSPHMRKIKDALRTESGPTSLNWFIAGHAIDESHWYFSTGEGGRVLGNMCHWLDASITLIGRSSFYPCIIRPASAPGSQNDFVLGIECADGSLVSIAFSAKGHTFEGVREVLNAQRGSTLVNMRDFEETRVEAGQSRDRHRTRYRNHGHFENVKNSHLVLSRARNSGESPEGVLASGLLSLGARRALTSGRAVAAHLPAVLTPDVRTDELLSWA